MRSRILALPALAVAAAALFAVPAARAGSQVSLESCAQPLFKDLVATIRVVSRDDRELARISKGLSEVYRLDRRQVTCKEPERVRLEGKRGILTVRMITNGQRKLTEVPSLRIRKVEDLRKEPGKGDSISDLGVVTPAWAASVESRWLRSEPRGGKPTQVFEVWDRADPRSRRTVWIDPATKTIVERISHHRSKKLDGFKKRLVYSELRQVDGIWLPMRVTLYSGANRLAADVRYDTVQVNTNPPDALFRF